MSNKSHLAGFVIPYYSTEWLMLSGENEFLLPVNTLSHTVKYSPTKERYNNLRIMRELDGITYKNNDLEDEDF